MTRDDIIRMAHDAGMTPISHVSTSDVICNRVSLERFAALVAAAEREACIKACDSVDLVGADDCIFAIRERGAP